MTTTPADYPCQCRACGVMILESVTDMCPDCEDDMNAYYDDRGDAQAEAQSEEYEYTDAEAAEAEARADANADAPYYEDDDGEAWDYGDGPDW